MPLVPTGKSLGSGIEVLKRGERDYPLTAQKNPIDYLGNRLHRNNQNNTSNPYSPSPSGSYDFRKYLSQSEDLYIRKRVA